MEEMSLISEAEEKGSESVSPFFNKNPLSYKGEDERG